MSEDIDENTQDLTVYDLAEKIAAGRILTVAANGEVMDELDRVRSAISRLAEDLSWDAALDTPRNAAVELLRLCEGLRKLVFKR